MSELKLYRHLKSCHGEEEEEEEGGGGGEEGEEEANPGASLQVDKYLYYKNHLL